ncbi:hypothetical protein A2331_04345 [Candidatus Falkowbacteria bacterium RIFOXYB2_FULL_34_18]|uniref:UPF0235 protein A2531_07290 n=1 Tax=Candidatus Falkowbacteria bacterium RIFOXYD2_FULL_34_120 TaxID=1798007 RepID=A0A1F5TM42_9BACT|nr:MAG: hypothetical protein A2331_04345 [Candidatus Falkowbacteria bacterium RIFOXYB2_FULL_34_18]OGF30267.1 MAG: hypothetical protein A2500_06720 [Candidatus Falkowbacteria bacterium RIFOXYC12_FULL_34_55]OGF37819.1 MAG: hypothetical protein A2466_03850 [Candidatus Falkowbacteria bacterium RIFOXYC2_FULL_34_220]OGF39580.1 MAG: hypothetical protein A2515_03565 [Candidatus Falkowbacteria bacterium RIFOXYD12_FULL_34_57]OGF40003.1 MAG: hypothetical protein A2531_07290 [Candidatus Falkowbacteria bact
MLKNFKDQLNKAGEVYLKIKVHPGAPISCVKDIIIDKDDCVNNEIIKLNINALPTRGKANQELIKFLSKEFSVDKNNVKIISGAGSRIKLIKVNNKLQTTKNK